jgi:sugar lactone lactonase YvrE
MKLREYIGIGSAIAVVEILTICSALYNGLREGFAHFYQPCELTTDREGNLYTAYARGNEISKRTPSGESTTLAAGESGFADGQKGTAQFAWLKGITVDAAGNLFVADYHRIRKVTQNGEVSTLAGGEKGFADGKGSAARFKSPRGIAIDATGNLYVTDTGNRRIRKVTPDGEVTTLAGSRQGFADGQGDSARFDWLGGIVIDATGNLYVMDCGNRRIRKVTPAGVVSTLAGNGEKDLFVCAPSKSISRFWGSNGIAMDAEGNLYVPSWGGIHKEGNRYVPDWGGIHKITPTGEISTLARDSKDDATKPRSFSSIAIDAANNLYVLESRGNSCTVEILRL